MLAEVRLGVGSFVLAVVTNCWLADSVTTLADSATSMADSATAFLSSTTFLLPALGVKLTEALSLWHLQADHRLICVTGYLLGLSFLLGISLASPFGLYLCFLSFFHFSEYVATGLGNPQNLSWDSYLVNHSYAYGVAMVLSWLEYGLEAWLLPSTKEQSLVTGLGLLLCVVGELVRKSAMLTAGKSFNHLVQSSRSEEHQLVTSGIYSWCRHPSYAGWFLWSVGSQLILCNPLCCVAYTAVTFMFFKERIFVEEFMLLQFFGSSYRSYQDTVATGIPFIRGYLEPVWGGGDQQAQSVGHHQAQSPGHQQAQSPGPAGDQGDHKD